MNVEVDEVYKFAFKTGFNWLDNIYRVLALVDYDQLLIDDVDLFVSLYNLVGKTQGELEADLPDISKEAYYILEDVVSLNKIYVPRSYVIGLPQGNIKEYSNVVLTADLDVWADPTALNNVKATIADALEGAYGITQAPLLIKAGSTWMAESDYNDIEEQRETDRTGVTNSYTEIQRLTSEIAKKDARIAALEQLVVQLDT